MATVSRGRCSHADAADREELGAVINFGSSVGHIPVRGAVMQGGEATPFSVAADPCCMLETKQFSQGACVVSQTISRTAPFPACAIVQHAA